MCITRFAPSPTGHLHLGHAYSARLAHDFAKKNGGEFLLRFEDIDHTRRQKKYYLSIEEDLQWLGLRWSGKPVSQSTRTPYYQEALTKLMELGILYPCFCTRKDIANEISRLGAAPHPGELIKYPGTCRDLSSSQSSSLLKQGRDHSWRLHSAKAAKLLPKNLTFTDVERGIITVQAELLGDIILARKDIATSYHLAVTVDDAAQEITHIIRGEDLLDSTHIHSLLQSLLNLPRPTYHHHKILTDSNGQRLSKRHDSLTIRSLREGGTSPNQVWDMVEKL